MMKYSTENDNNVVSICKSHCILYVHIHTESLHLIYNLDYKTRSNTVYSLSFRQSELQEKNVI